MQNADLNRKKPVQVRGIGLICAILLAGAGAWWWIARDAARSPRSDAQDPMSPQGAALESGRLSGTREPSSQPANSPAPVRAAEARASTASISSPSPVAAGAGSDAAPAEPERPAHPRDPARIGAYANQSNPTAACAGFPAQATVRVGDRSFALRPHQDGAFPTVFVAPNTAARVRVQYESGVVGGDPVRIMAPDGASVDGAMTARLAAGPGGVLEFDVKVGDWPGYHLVNLRSSGDTKRLVFWVGPPPATPDPEASGADSPGAAL
jgi:hypothetical protein